MDFYVSFTGTPEEIAALVEKLQERQPVKAEISIAGEPNFKGSCGKPKKGEAGWLGEEATC